MTRAHKIHSLKTASEGIKEIMTTSIEKTLEEAAIYVGVSVFKLREMFCERLGTSDPNNWETIPTEHEALLEEFKNQMDAAATVKPYLPEASETAAPQTPALTVIDEPQKPGKAAKRDSTKLTAKQKKAIELELKAAKDAEAGIDGTQEIVSLRNEFEKGQHQQKKQELAKINGRLKVREAAHKKFLLDIKKESENRSEEDIIESLRLSGIPTSERTLADIKEFSEMALGKFEVVFQESLENPWTDGLEDSTEMEELMTWSV